jgi:NNP family nitrate/nitrite transporter-like MFS transporter
MGGTAISALTTVRLVETGTSRTPFLLTAACLAAYGVLAAVLLRDAPGRARPTPSVVRRLAGATSLPITWEASGLYALGFGGYVAFSVYLPTYLRTAYGLDHADAAMRMAAFVLLAVLMRPVGGFLSDRIPPLRVLAVSFAVVALGALVQSFTPDLEPVGTVACLSMAAALGTASGAVFAHVAQRAPGEQVGSVTGLVGAAGGLGGFVPPLIMSGVHSRTGSYGGGLLTLFVVSLLALWWCVHASRRSSPLTGIAGGPTLRLGR